MKIGIVGCGVVGSAMVRFLARVREHEAVVFDKFLSPYNGPSQKIAINTCDLVFICVPTPAASDGVSCDISAVEECVRWITAPVCIRSTIIPGTVDRLSAATGKQIAFSPEYLGEQPRHPWAEEGSCGFLIVGGPRDLCERVTAVYQSCLGPDMRYYYTTARTAELCKYMENCFLAAKVAFVNQFYDIAQVFHVDFEELRKLWLADPRVESSHTVVTKERGFRGRCLPKDVSALVAAMEPSGGAPLLEAIHTYNRSLCESVDRAASE
jgi:UDPglucose 6-dehydrogenase